MVTRSDLRVRARRDADLPGLMPVLQRAHDEKGYPKRASAVRPDWLAMPDELSAWVAEHDGLVVGHAPIQRTLEPDSL